MNITVKESPYFYRMEDGLKQAVDVYVDGVECGCSIRISIDGNDSSLMQNVMSDGGSCSFRLAVQDSIALKPSKAKVSVTAGDEHSEHIAAIGNIRPWTFYIAQDKHLDYGWKHPVEDVVQRINNLTDYYINLNSERGSRFNFDCTLWFEEYAAARPESRKDRLVELLKSGRFQMGAMLAVLFNGIMTEEETIQCLMPARRLEKRYGIPFTTAVPTEVPGMNWGLAAILKGCGVEHIVRGAYCLNNENLKTREPYSLFWWEGPDGSRVLTKFDLLKDTHSFGGYAEAMPLCKGPYEKRVAHIEEAVARYEAYGNYPFNAVLLAGTGWDEYPFDSEALDFIEWFNSRGWEYPRLIDAAWDDYWKFIHEEIDKGLQVPVLKGDWGCSWEEWPAQLAHQNEVYRKAREIALAAQSASAAAFIVCSKSLTSRESLIRNSFFNLNKFCDHNIGGILPHEADDMRDRKTTYVYNALKDATSGLEGALSNIAFQISTDNDIIMVYNPLSWKREGMVSIPVEKAGKYRIYDMETGRIVYSQTGTMGNNPEVYLSFTAKNIPAFGYRTYSVAKEEDEGKCMNSTGYGTACAFAEESVRVLENEYFRATLDTKRGGIASLFDKRLGKELADRNSPYNLNQFVYTSDEKVYSVNTAKLKVSLNGEVFSHIVTESGTFRCRLKTTYTLYHEMDRIDICNELVKEISDEKQTCHFVFPFNVPGREYHYDSTAAILKPGLEEDGGSQLRGAGMGSYCGLYFADASNSDYGITLASLDSHLYHFGSNTMGRTEGFIDPCNATVYSLVMENYNRADNCLRQGGQEAFVFRYSLMPHTGGFNAAKSLKFARGVCSPLDGRKVWSNTEGKMKPGAASVLTIASADGLPVENVVVSGFKVAEELDGTVVRLRECAGCETELVISCGLAMITAAGLVDHLEREIGMLNCCNGKVKVKVPALGLVSVKMLFRKISR